MYFIKYNQKYFQIYKINNIYVLINVMNTKHVFLLPNSLNTSEILEKIATLI